MANKLAETVAHLGAGIVPVCTLRRQAVAENADPLPILNNAIAVRDTVARLIVDVYAGKLHPRIAAGLAPLLNLQLRALETTDLERRVGKLEKLLDAAEANDGVGVSSNEDLHGRVRRETGEELGFSASTDPERTC